MPEADVWRFWTQRARLEAPTVPPPAEPLQNLPLAATVCFIFKFFFDLVLFTSTFLCDFFFYLWFDLFLAYLLFENVQLSNSSLICQSEVSVISRKWGENEPFVLHRLKNCTIVSIS